MDAEKLAMQRRIDTLDQYAVKLHAALTEAERENARLKAELEIAKIQNQYISEVADAYEKDIEKLERERDAAVADFKKKRDCNTCKYDVRKSFEEPCVDCGFGHINREWRGLCESNGGAEDA